MITFYPGPSKVYEQVGDYMQEAVKSGILSMNHRSEPFMQLLASAISNLKSKLNVPQDYEVYIVSSATECWEIVAQSLITSGSLHLFNGAFGEKWAEYTQKLTGTARAHFFDLNTLPDLKNLDFRDGELVCVTHNETSNGTALPEDFMHSLRSKTNALIAVDATSSMAGVEMPWAAGDVWYASVQKCFGLPSGMGVMIVSPNAVAQAVEVNDHKHYNSLLFMRENFLKNQTPYTPNILGIYLLDKVLSQVADIQTVAEKTRKRAADMYAFLSQNGFQILAENENVRSDTVIAIQTSKEHNALLKQAAKGQGITLGNGYGKDKDSQFRIANFPAITDGEAETLKHFLQKMASE